MRCDLRNPFPFYGKADFLTCSSIDSRKRHSKTPKTDFSTVFWSSHSRKFSEIKVFVFTNFLEILFNKISILWSNELLDMLLRRSPKIALKNTQNHLSLTHFEVRISENFQIWKYSLFPFFSKFYSKKNFILWHIGFLDNQILEKLPVFLKGLRRHYNVTSIYCHL